MSKINLLATASGKAIALMFYILLRTFERASILFGGHVRKSCRNPVILGAVISLNALFIDGVYACIKSGDQTSINSALVRAGSVAALCPESVFLLDKPIKFTAPNQRLFTEGHPTDKRRAILRVRGDQLATAIDGRNQSGIRIENVIVDGSRPSRGRLDRGTALIQIGGNASGQVVTKVRAYEPRGWSVLHIFEGSVGKEYACSSAQITDNEIGPAGKPNGEWADGISLACPDSVVRGNVITDVTDGGIVIFGAPGSLITGNTIRALNRVLLGGINMVDYAPFNGDYKRTVVSRNLIDSGQVGGYIKIGIAIGPRVWGGISHSGPNEGGRVANNRLTGNNFGYGIAVNGAKDFIVVDNKLISDPIFDGLMNSCPRGNHPPNEFTVNYSTSSGSYEGFSPGNIDHGICLTPQFNFRAGRFIARTNQPIRLGLLMYVVMQSDGNFVIYGAPGQALWSTRTAGTDCSNGQCTAIFQGDGNFVLYRNGQPFWASNTESRGGIQIRFAPVAPWLQITSPTGVIWEANRY